MRRSPAALMPLLLAGCAATTPMPDPTGPVTANGSDCAVIAAVAREHYNFSTAETPPPLWLDGEGSGWAPRCDWSRYGLRFPATYDPARAQTPGQPLRWVQFKQPRYDGQGALVDSAIMHGPLAGNGIQCRVRSGIAGWTVSDCQITWVN
tara:strand:+ start:411 stop:860 length:450 start_codon:yes stop_codon:yes gene_type:complete